MPPFSLTTEVANLCIFFCPICPKSDFKEFDNKANLLSHMKLVHKVGFGFSVQEYVKEAR